jgi:hypothetical protein
MNAATRVVHRDYVVELPKNNERRDRTRQQAVYDPEGDFGPKAMIINQPPAPAA